MTHIVQNAKAAKPMSRTDAVFQAERLNAADLVGRNYVVAPLPLDGQFVIVVTNEGQDSLVGYIGE